MTEDLDSDNIDSKIILDLFKKVANGQYLDIHKIVDMLRERREESTKPSIPILNTLGINFRMRIGELLVPNYVAHFFYTLIEATKGSNVLDPWGRDGTLGAYIAVKNANLMVDIVTRYLHSELLVQHLNLENINLHIGEINNVASDLSEKYDCIISIPPLGLPKTEYFYSNNGVHVELFDEPGLLLIAEVAKLINHKGIMAIVVPPRFTRGGGEKSVRNNLKQMGLHLTALLEFEAGAFPGTSFRPSLAVIEQRSRSELFVAEVPREIDAQKQLIDRLINRKNGPIARLGRLLPPEKYHGLAALEAHERYVRMAKKNGLCSVPFRDAVTEINMPNRKGFEFIKWDENPHAIYLPIFARVRATTRKSELPNDQKNYLQLITDPNVVLPVYLADYLNAPLGQAWRESVTTGYSNPRMFTSLMADSKLYLPPTMNQEEIVGATLEIDRLSTELNELKFRLWSEQGKASKIVGTIRNYHRKDCFQDWVETLPFPLASILRSYYAIDITPGQKYQRLFYFFEAFSAYCAMVHVSAFRSNEPLWNKQKDTIVKIFKQQNISLEKASFGTWIAIVALLSSKLRSMLQSGNESPLACNLFATSNPKPLELFASKELIELLQRVNHLRNIWPGHGGSASRADAVERHTFLEQDLGKLRELVNWNFMQYQLIEPQEAEIFEGPVYHFHVRRVMGSNPQLEHGDIEITVPAKKGCLYMHHTDHDRVLELVPFVRLEDKPQPASYFYNSHKNGTAHLVSYHLSESVDTSDLSNLDVPSSSLTSLFNELRINGKTNDTEGQ